jgi:hypothetical protein
MSGVATLKAGSKRVFEEMSIDVPPGPGCSPGRLPLVSSVPKRSRPTAVAAATPTSSSGMQPACSQNQRPFTPDEVAAFARHVPKRLKRVAEKVATGHIAPTEKVFSVLDVRDIVESVVAEREAKLKEECAKLLNDRLAEQFRDFTKFNEDFVARQYRGKDYAYLS